jgi:hypothetical protein
MVFVMPYMMLVVRVSFHVFRHIVHQFLDLTYIANYSSCTCPATVFV